LGNKTIVKEMTSHFETGSKMPDEMIRNLLRSRKHMAATDLCHELYLSALDIDLYKKKEFWMDIMKNLWPVYHSPLQLDKRDSHVCTMVDIFSGDLAAAYYCKLWSQMLAADAYQQFVEKGQGREAWRNHGRR
jgi:oligopeptidase A